MIIKDEALWEVWDSHEGARTMVRLRAVADAAIAADRAARAEAVVPEYDRNAYEELRAIIDGGSEGHMIGWNDFQTGWEAAMEAQRAANAQEQGIRR